MPADRPTCATCRWWEPEADGYGECRRRAPQSRPGHDTGPRWPGTVAFNWCGEHQPGEARIPCAVHHDRPATPHLVRGQHACAECVAAAFDALSATASAATTPNPTTHTIPADAPASDAGSTTQHKEP